ncbi:protein phosphatase 2C domain-containing protein [Nocardia sp. NPDC002869]|uniref:protein phosphatase 2C domain-containing protein n=1 Tax=Nocardia sp. NPDC002869 TaxID=3161032 RepID=UPI00398C88AA
MDGSLFSPVVQLRNAFEYLPGFLRTPIEMVVFGGELPGADISGMRRMAAELRARSLELEGHSADIDSLLAREDSVGETAEQLREALSSYRQGAAQLGKDVNALADQGQAAANDAEKWLCVMFTFGIHLAWKIYGLLAAAAASGPAGQVAAAPAVESTLVQGRAEVAVMRANLQRAIQAGGAKAAAQLSDMGPAQFAKWMGTAVALPVGVEVGVQGLQVATGDRAREIIGEDGSNPTGIDLKSIEVAAVSGAGGAAGGMLAGRFAPLVVPQIATSRVAMGLVHGTAGAISGLGAAALVAGWPQHYTEVLGPLLNGAVAGGVYAQSARPPAIDGGAPFTPPDAISAGHDASTAAPRQPIEISVESKRAWEAARQTWKPAAETANTAGERGGPPAEVAGQAGAAQSQSRSGQQATASADGAGGGTPTATGGRAPEGAAGRAPEGAGGRVSGSQAAASSDAAAARPRSEATTTVERPQADKQGTAGRATAPRSVEAARETAPPPKIPTDVGGVPEKAGAPVGAHAAVADGAGNEASARPQPVAEGDAGSPDTRAEHGPPSGDEHATAQRDATAEQSGQERSESSGRAEADGTDTPAAGDHSAPVRDEQSVPATDHDSLAEAAGLPRSDRDRAVDLLIDFHQASAEHVPESHRLSNLPDDVLKAGLHGGDEHQSLLATVELIRRGTVSDAVPGGMVLRVEQAEAVYAMKSRPVEMKPGEGKSLVFMATAIQRAVHHGSVLVVTTTDGLANREVVTYEKLLTDSTHQKLMTDFGIDVFRADQENGFGPIKKGRPAIVVATGETVGHLCNAGKEPPRHVLIDEMDGIIDRGERQFLRSEGPEQAASEETAGQVFDAHKFLTEALADGSLSHEDFGLRSIAEEIGVHPDGTPEVQFWYDGRPELTPEGRAKVEALPNGQNWLEGMGASRLETAAHAEFLVREGVHYEMDAGKIVIIDQAEHGLQRNPKTSSESRWSAEPGKASLAQAIEAKEIRAAEARDEKADEHRIVVRADAESAKRIDSVEIYRVGEGSFFDEVTGASGTLTDLNPVLQKIYGLEPAHEVGRSQTHRLVEGQHDVAENTHAKLATIAEYANEIRNGGAGRFQEILCHRNDLVQRQVEALVRAGVPREAIEAVDAKRIIGWGADWEAQLQRVFDEAGEQGKILVINRQGQRGVDISVSDAVKAMGGMHVWMTEAPEQSYIHEQAKNRTARNGQLGSAQVVMSPQDALIRNAMHLREVREAVIHYEQTVSAHAADPTPQTHDALVEARQSVRELVPELQQRALRHSTADFVRHHAFSTIMPALTLAEAETGQYGSDVDFTRPDGPADRTARLAGLLGVPGPAVADQIAALERHGSVDPIRDLLRPAGIAPAAAEALRQHVEATAPAATLQRALFTDEQALNHMTPSRDRLAAELGLPIADVDGAEGMRTLEPALTEARDALASALGYPVASINPGIARDILGEAVGDHLTAVNIVESDVRDDTASAAADSGPVGHDSRYGTSQDVAAQNSDTQNNDVDQGTADDIVAAASRYLALSALLDSVVQIHRRSPNSCVNNAVTGMRVLCPDNAGRFRAPSTSLEGHGRETVRDTFGAGLEPTGSLDEVVESLKSRPGGITVLVYKWKDTRANGTSTEADDHMVLLVNDSTSVDKPNLVVVDLAASRDRNSENDYGPRDLRNRRTLLNKAAEFDDWRREQEVHINKLPANKRQFETIEFDRDGNLVSGSRAEGPDAERLPRSQQPNVSSDTVADIESAFAGLPGLGETIPALSGAAGEVSNETRHEPSRFGSRPHDGPDRITDDPGPTGDHTNTADRPLPTVLELIQDRARLNRLRTRRDDLRAQLRRLAGVAVEPFGRRPVELLYTKLREELRAGVGPVADKQRIVELIEKYRELDALVVSADESLRVAGVRTYDDGSADTMPFYRPWRGTAEEFDALSDAEKHAVAKAELSESTLDFDNPATGAEYARTHLGTIAAEQAESIQWAKQDANSTSLFGYSAVSRYVATPYEEKTADDPARPHVRHLDAAILSNRTTVDSWVVAEAVLDSADNADPASMRGQLCDAQGYLCGEMGSTPSARQQDSDIVHLRVPAGTPMLGTESATGTPEVLLMHGTRYVATRAFADEDGLVHVYGFVLADEWGPIPGSARNQTGAAPDSIGSRPSEDAARRPSPSNGPSVAAVPVANIRTRLAELRAAEQANTPATARTRQLFEFANAVEEMENAAAAMARTRADAEAETRRRSALSAVSSIAATVEAAARDTDRHDEAVRMLGRLDGSVVGQVHLVYAALFDHMRDAGQYVDEVDDTDEHELARSARQYESLVKQIDWLDALITVLERTSPKDYSQQYRSLIDTIPHDSDPRALDPSPLQSSLMREATDSADRSTELEQRAAAAEQRHRAAVAAVGELDRLMTPTDPRGPVDVELPGTTRDAHASSTAPVESALADQFAEDPPHIQLLARTMLARQPASVAQLVADAQIVLFGETHTNPAGPEFLEQQAAALRAAGVTHYGIEAPPNPVFDALNAGEQVDLTGIQCGPGFGNWAGAVKAMAAAGITVVPFDVEKPSSPKGSPLRDVRESRMAQVITDTMRAPGAKMAILVGLDHLTRQQRMWSYVTGAYGISLAERLTDAGFATRTVAMWGGRPGMREVVDDVARRLGLGDETFVTDLAEVNGADRGFRSWESDVLLHLGTPETYAAQKGPRSPVQPTKLGYREPGGQHSPADRTAAVGTNQLQLTTVADQDSTGRQHAIGTAHADIRQFVADWANADQARSAETLGSNLVSMYTHARRGGMVSATKSGARGARILRFDVSDVGPVPPSHLNEYSESVVAGRLRYMAHRFGIDRRPDGTTTIWFEFDEAGPNFSEFAVAAVHGKEMPTADPAVTPQSTDGRARRELDLGHAAGVTDIGGKSAEQRHRRNQDAFAIATATVSGERMTLAIVTDGVSHSKGAERAAQVGSEAAAEVLARRAAAAEAGAGWDPVAVVAEAVEAAQQAVLDLIATEEFAETSDVDSPKATIVAALVTPTQVITDSRGDARAVWISLDDGASRELTEPDTYVRQYMEMFDITEREAMGRPEADKPLTGLGKGWQREWQPPQPQVFEPTGPGIVGLFTDGPIKHLAGSPSNPRNTAESVAETVAGDFARSGTLLGAAQAYIQGAIAAKQTNDNLTAVLIEGPTDAIGARSDRTPGDHDNTATPTPSLSPDDPTDPAIGARPPHSPWSRTKQRVADAQTTGKPGQAEPTTGPSTEDPRPIAQPAEYFGADVTERASVQTVNPDDVTGASTASRNAADETQLSGDHLRVLRWITDGWDNARITAALGGQQASKYVGEVASALGIANKRYLIAAEATRRGLVQPQSPLADLGKRLTPRQIVVLAHLSRGRTRGEIATMFGLSPRTVDKHVNRALPDIGSPTLVTAMPRIVGALDTFDEEAIARLAASRSDTTAGRSRDEALAQRLSPTEAAVLRQVRQGRTHTEIAAESGMSEHEVRRVLADARRKVGDSDRSRLAALHAEERAHKSKDAAAPTRAGKTSVPSEPAPAPAPRQSGNTSRPGTVTGPTAPLSPAADRPQTTNRGQTPDAAAQSPWSRAKTGTPGDARTASLPDQSTGLPRSDSIGARPRSEEPGSGSNDRQAQRGRNTASASPFDRFGTMLPALGFDDGVPHRPERTVPLAGAQFAADIARRLWREERAEQAASEQSADSPDRLRDLDVTEQLYARLADARREHTAALLRYGYWDARTVDLSGWRDHDIAENDLGWRSYRQAGPGERAQQREAARQYREARDRLTEADRELSRLVEAAGIDPRQAGLGRHASLVGALQTFADLVGADWVRRPDHPDFGAAPDDLADSVLARVLRYPGQTYLVWELRRLGPGAVALVSDTSRGDAEQYVLSNIDGTIVEIERSTGVLREFAPKDYFRSKVEGVFFGPDKRPVHPVGGAWDRIPLFDPGTARQRGAEVTRLHTATAAQQQDGLSELAARRTSVMLKQYATTTEYRKLATKLGLDPDTLSRQQLDRMAQTPSLPAERPSSFYLPAPAPLAERLPELVRIAAELDRLAGQVRELDEQIAAGLAGRPQSEPGPADRARFHGPAVVTLAMALTRNPDIRPLGEDSGEHGAPEFAVAAALGSQPRTFTGGIEQVCRVVEALGDGGAVALSGAAGEIGALANIRDRIVAVGRDGVVLKEMQLDISGDIPEVTGFVFTGAGTAVHPMAADTRAQLMELAAQYATASRAGDPETVERARRAADVLCYGPGRSEPVQYGTGYRRTDPSLFGNLDITVLPETLGRLWEQLRTVEIDGRREISFDTDGMSWSQIDALREQLRALDPALARVGWSGWGRAALAELDRRAGTAVVVRADLEIARQSVQWTEQGWAEVTERPVTAAEEAEAAGTTDRIGRLERERDELMRRHDLMAGGARSEPGSALGFPELLEQVTRRREFIDGQLDRLAVRAGTDLTRLDQVTLPEGEEQKRLELRRHQVELARLAQILRQLREFRHEPDPVEPMPHRAPGDRQRQPTDPDKRFGEPENRYAEPRVTPSSQLAPPRGKPAESSPNTENRPTTWAVGPLSTELDTDRPWDDGIRPAELTTNIRELAVLHATGGGGPLGGQEEPENQKPSPDQEAEQAATPHPDQPDAQAQSPEQSGNSAISPSASAPAAEANLSNAEPTGTKEADTKSKSLSQLIRTDSDARRRMSAEFLNSIGAEVGSATFLLYMVNEMGAESGSWIMMGASTPAFIGPLIAGYMADNYSRKKLMAGGGIASALGWLAATGALAADTSYTVPVVAGSIALTIGGGVVYNAASNKYFKVAFEGSQEAVARFNNLKMNVPRIISQSAAPLLLIADTWPAAALGLTFSIQNLASLKNMPDNAPTRNSDETIAHALRNSVSNGIRERYRPREQRRISVHVMVSNLYMGMQGIQFTDLVLGSGLTGFQQGAAFALVPSAALLGNRVPDRWLQKFSLNTFRLTRMTALTGTSVVLAASDSVFLSSAALAAGWMVQGAAGIPLNTYIRKSTPAKHFAAASGVSQVQTQAAHKIGWGLSGAAVALMGGQSMSIAVSSALGAYTIASATESHSRRRRRSKMLDGIHQVAAAAAALGLDNATEPKQGRNTVRDFRAAITPDSATNENAALTQFTKTHLDPDTVDPLAHVLDLVEDPNNRVDTVFLLVADGDDVRPSLITDTGGKGATIFDVTVPEPDNRDLRKPNKRDADDQRVPRVRTRERWKPSFRAIEDIDEAEAYIACFERVDGKLSPLALPDRNLSVPSDGLEILGPPRMSPRVNQRRDDECLDRTAEIATLIPDRNRNSYDDRNKLEKLRDFLDLRAKLSKEDDLSRFEKLVDGSRPIVIDAKKIDDVKKEVVDIAEKNTDGKTYILVDYGNKKMHLILAEIAGNTTIFYDINQVDKDDEIPRVRTAEKFDEDFADAKKIFVYQLIDNPDGTREDLNKDSPQDPKAPRPQRGSKITGRPTGHDPDDGSDGHGAGAPLTHRMTEPMPMPPRPALGDNRPAVVDFGLLQERIWLLLGQVGEASDHARVPPDSATLREARRAVDEQWRALAAALEVDPAQLADLSATILDDPTRLPADDPLRSLAQRLGPADRQRAAAIRKRAEAIIRLDAVVAELDDARQVLDDEATRRHHEHRYRKYEGGIWLTDHAKLVPAERGRKPTLLIVATEGRHERARRELVAEHAEFAGALARSSPYNVAYITVSPHADGEVDFQFESKEYRPSNAEIGARLMMAYAEALLAGRQADRIGFDTWMESLGGFSSSTTLDELEARIDITEDVDDTSARAAVIRMLTEEHRPRARWRDAPPDIPFASTSHEIVVGGVVIQVQMRENHDANRWNRFELAHLYRAADTGKAVAWMFAGGLRARSKEALAKKVARALRNGRIDPAFTRDEDGSRLWDPPRPPASDSAPDRGGQGDSPIGSRPGQGPSDRAAAAAAGPLALLSAARAGDETAREQLWRRFYRSIAVLIAGAMAGRPDQRKLVEQILREVFDLAFDPNGPDAPGRDVEEWLRAIARDVVDRMVFRHVCAGVAAVLRRKGMESSPAYRLLVEPIPAEAARQAMAALADTGYDRWLRQNLWAGGDPADVANPPLVNQAAVRQLLRVVADAVGKDVPAIPEEPDSYPADIALAQNDDATHSPRIEPTGALGEKSEQTGEGSDSDAAPPSPALLRVALLHDPYLVIPHFASLPGPESRYAELHFGYGWPIAKVAASTGDTESAVHDGLERIARLSAGKLPPEIAASYQGARSGHALTIEDLAREAGTSPAEADDALNGSPGVGPETRQQVFAAADRLRYRRELLCAFMFHDGQAAWGLDGRVLAAATRSELENAFGRLGMLEQQVIESRFEELRSVAETAALLGMTESLARVLERTAVRGLVDALAEVVDPAVAGKFGAPAAGVRFAAFEAVVRLRRLEHDYPDALQPSEFAEAVQAPYSAVRLINRVHGIVSKEEDSVGAASRALALLRVALRDPDAAIPHFPDMSGPEALYAELHFGYGWPIDEIAKSTGVEQKSVYDRLAHLAQSSVAKLPLETVAGHWVAGGYRTPTTADLAEQVNASPAGISRALNGSPDVAPETRQKVLATADRLGYQRSRFVLLRRELLCAFMFHDHQASWGLDGRVLAAAMSDELHGALGRLDGSARRVIESRFKELRSVAETAAQLGMAESMVRELERTAVYDLVEALAAIVKPAMAAEFGSPAAQVRFAPFEAMVRLRRLERDYPGLLQPSEFAEATQAPAAAVRLINRVLGSASVAGEGRPSAAPAPDGLGPRSPGTIGARPGRSNDPSEFFAEDPRGARSARANGRAGSPVARWRQAVLIQLVELAGYSSTAAGRGPYIPDAWLEAVEQATREQWDSALATLEPEEAELLTRTYGHGEEPSTSDYGYLKEALTRFAGAIAAARSSESSGKTDGVGIEAPVTEAGTVPQIPGLLPREEYRFLGGEDGVELDEDLAALQASEPRIPARPTPWSGGAQRISDDRDPRGGSTRSSASGEAPAQ